MDVIMRDIPLSDLTITPMAERPSSDRRGFFLENFTRNPQKAQITGIGLHEIIILQSTFFSIKVLSLFIQAFVQYISSTWVTESNSALSYSTQQSNLL